MFSRIHENAREYKTPSFFCFFQVAHIQVTFVLLLKLFLTETTEESIPTCKQAEKIWQNCPQISRYVRVM